MAARMTNTATRTPLKAIRAKCLECSNGQAIEVTRCPIESCALFEYRFGRWPGVHERQLEKERERWRQRQEATSQDENSSRFRRS